MSPKNSLLTVGLTALGLLGYSATRAAYPGDPPAPSGPPPAPAPSPTPTVLLLSNGRILRGPIAAEGSSYVIRQNGGEIKVPRDQAEGTFDSMTGLYRYKRAQVPDRDPDEHLKLARWCLGQNLTAEARAELKAVVAVSPSSGEARAMLASLDAAAVRLAARPRVDAALVQTGAERVEPAAVGAEPGDAPPAEMNPAIYQKARRELGVSTLPVIFDLPPPVAVKRADQYARLVHPVLQAACAKCHNERHPGKFQLIEVKTRRDLTANVFRANLDATLQLIDPENPARSELLSSSLVPHGSASTQRPIFRGSNDPRYQVIASWVNSLRTAAPGRPADGVVQTRFGPKEGPAGGGFASDRGAGPAGSSRASSTLIPDQPAFETAPPSAIPPSRYTPGRGMVTEKAPPAAEEFPAPFMYGGPKPRMNVAPAQPGAVPVPPPAPVDDAPEPAKPRKPAKPVKIDPALLEKALMNRNGAR